MQLTVDSEKELLPAAHEIIKFAGKQTIWLFYGEMGSGKTALIKAIARVLNVGDNVHSPSFNIVNEYRNADGEIFYHFDFYRIKNETEAMDIGVDEYFSSGNLCLVEWPEKISGLLPDEFLRIEISIVSETVRKINITHYGRASQIRI